MSKEDFSPRRLLSKETFVQGDKYMYFSPRTFSLSHHLISGPNIVELSQGVELSLGVYHRLGGWGSRGPWAPIAAPSL